MNEKIGTLIAGILLLTALAMTVRAGVGMMDVKGMDFQSTSCYVLQAGNQFSYSVSGSSVPVKNTISATTAPKEVCVMVWWPNSKAKK